MVTTVVEVPEAHERIRRRRDEVTRLAGRRWRRRIIAVVAVVGVLVGAWSLLHSSVMGVSVIEVVGNTHVSREDVIAASGIGLGEAVLSIDPDAAARSIASLAWVAHASVETHLIARSVSIRIIERVPVVAAPAEQGYTLVDRSGRVVTMLPVMVAGVPTLKGPTAVGGPGTQLPPAAVLGAEAIARVPSALIGTVVGAEWDRDGGTWLVLADDRLVRLPSADGLGDAFVALAAMLTRDDLAPGVIDLRVPSAPVIASPAVSLTKPSP